MSDRKIDFDWLRRNCDVCTEGVTRKGEFQPCNKPAVAIRFEPTDHDDAYPVCANHARGEMVTLPQLLVMLGNSQTTAIGELNRHLDVFEGKGHTHVGIPFLRNHFWPVSS